MSITLVSVREAPEPGTAPVIRGGPILLDRQDRLPPRAMAWLRVRSLCLLVGIGFANAGAQAETRAPADSMRAFFPSRPVGAKLHTTTGVLTEFGVGNGLGGLELRRGGKTQALYTGANLRLDGRPVTCDHPPRHGAPKSIFCRDWPASVAIGSTFVKATYWLQARPGFPGLVRVTDDLRSLPQRS